MAVFVMTFEPLKCFVAVQQFYAHRGSGFTLFQFEEVERNVPQRLLNGACAERQKPVSF